MELVLNRRTSLFEQLHNIIFRAKQDNIFFEKAHGLDEPFQAVLSDIIDESGIKSPKKLVIVDPYFTNISCCDSEHVLEDFLKWIKENELGEVRVFTRERRNCFERDIQEKSEGAVLISNCRAKIHDRFWIFIDGGTPSIVTVGASFNGFTKGVSSIFYVAKVREEHQEKLLAALMEAGVKFEEKEEAHVNPDR